MAKHPPTSRILVVPDPTGLRYIDVSTSQSNHVAVLDILAARIKRGWYQGESLADAEGILSDLDYASAEAFLFARGNAPYYADVEDSRAY